NNLGGRIDHDGALGMLPDSQIRGMVACIVKPPHAVPVNKSLRFASARKIGSAVAGEHIVKDTQMLRNCVRVALITCRAEHQLPTRSVLCAEPSQELTMEGQLAHI